MTINHSHSSHSRHHHHEDGSTKFKRQQLNGIRRRKIMKKYGFISLIMIAVLMFIAVIWVYTAG